MDFKRGPSGIRKDAVKKCLTPGRPPTRLSAGSGGRSSLGHSRAGAQWNSYPPIGGAYAFRLGHPRCLFMVSTSCDVLGLGDTELSQTMLPLPARLH
jgi:hypothetical protein